MIREVEPPDWRLLRAVRLRALAESPHAFLTTLAEASEYGDAHWQERATPSEESTTFVLDADGRFDGMVTGFAHGDDVLLVAMWVDPALRGSGAAARLVEAVVDWARRRGSRRVVLTVEAGNERARRLYERCGFVEPAEPVELPYEAPPGSTNLVRAT